jgi:hypothetical protein
LGEDVQRKRGKRFEFNENFENITWTRRYVNIKKLPYLRNKGDFKSEYACVEPL